MCTNSSLGQDQSTVAHQAQMTVEEHSRMRCVQAHFSDPFPHYAQTAQSARSDIVSYD